MGVQYVCREERDFQFSTRDHPGLNKVVWWKLLCQPQVNLGKKVIQDVSASRKKRGNISKAQGNMRHALSNATKYNIKLPMLQASVLR